LFSLFLAISFPLAYTLDGRWFVRANPLVGFLTFGLAVATLLTTVAAVLFGRIFFLKNNFYWIFAKGNKYMA
jgi:hypothetical protein